MDKRSLGAQWPSAGAVGVGVAFSVLLISVASGVSDSIGSQLDKPIVRESGLVDVDTIKTILLLLTVVIVAAMLIQTAATVFVTVTTAMRTRRAEIAIRRQSGVMRSALLRELLAAMLLLCCIGGVSGEVVGVLVALVLQAVTVLPVHITPVAMMSPFPTTVVLSLLATLLPAWRAATASPALLRRT